MEDEKDVKAEMNLQIETPDCCPAIEMYAFGTYSVFHQTDPDQRIWANEENQQIVFNEYFNIWQLIEDGQTTMGTGLTKLYYYLNHQAG